MYKETWNKTNYFSKNNDSENNDSVNQGHKQPKLQFILDDNLPSTKELEMYDVMIYVGCAFYDTSKYYSQVKSLQKGI